MVKILLEDIDQVSYPIKDQFLKFIDNSTYKYMLGQDIVEGYKKSKFSYLNEYLMHLRQNDEEKFLASKENIQKNFNLRSFRVTEDFERDISFYILRAFGDSPLFKEGYDASIFNLNILMKLDKIPVFGLTSRGNPDEPDRIYNNCFEKTEQWNKNTGSLLTKIYFRESWAKHTVTTDLNKEYGVSPKDIICMIEDTVKPLEGFLRKEIPCVLINKNRESNGDVPKKLKKEYKDLLTIVRTSKDAKTKVIELYQKSLNKNP